jgi:hypothetical protein
MELNQPEPTLDEMFKYYLEDDWIKLGPIEVFEILKNKTGLCFTVNQSLSLVEKKLRPHYKGVDTRKVLFEKYKN